MFADPIKHIKFASEILRYTSSQYFDFYVIH